MTDNHPVVRIAEGQLKGKASQDYWGGKFFSFLGIPYAKPPVNELRFKAPVPAEPWQGVKDATKEGSECPSTHMLFLYVVGSEADCLHLNVYTKELPNDNNRGKPKPVMVWIHGGGFLWGSNKRELFGPDYLMSEDIVLVCINYRLGALGFLSLEDPSLGVPGNAGMKDMILALKWVQRNIKHFNGDPNNVTIFGESAGGAAVHYLCLSPLSKGLFHKAIAQSGCALNCWAKGCHNGKILAKQLGCNETDEKKILEYLKGIPPPKLLKAQARIKDSFTASTTRPLGPVVEKPSNEPAFLSQDPLEILKAGTFHKVPIMMGYTSQEGIFFEAVRKLTRHASGTPDFETEINPDLRIKPATNASKETAEKIKRFYFGEEEPGESNIEKMYTLKTDTQFVYGIHRCVALQRKTTTAPIYFYRMSLETSINYYKNVCLCKSVHFLFFLYYMGFATTEWMAKNLFLKMTGMVRNSNAPKGVCHADDVGYLFTSLMSPKLKPGSIEETSVKRFVKLWTNFARTGNPTPEPSDPILQVKWKPVTMDEKRYLDIGSQLKVGSNPDSDRIQFWDSLYDGSS